ncbi:hypothetical protein PR048_009489 [Dryococelus australis]|uniref:Uncharacterized protein n=1 Tax=Dryococelus australis TaxID=614101 RepID=A0ABQ9I056_9NEOP|nr:hypothetical protein PR048_009489 [Dryococelus australis]
MKFAVNSVLSVDLCVREAAKTFSVAKGILQDRVLKIMNDGKVQVVPKLGRYERTFSESYEQHLIAHMKRSDDMLMPRQERVPEACLRFSCFFDAAT